MLSRKWSDQISACIWSHPLWKYNGGIDYLREFTKGPIKDVFIGGFLCFNTGGERWFKEIMEKGKC